MADEIKPLGFYRDYLAGEFSRPEIQQEKSSFLHHHFIKESLLPEAGLWVPALALFLLFIFFYDLSSRSSSRSPRMAADPQAILKIRPVPEAPPRIAFSESLPDEEKAPQVLVKRVTSRAGSTLVYQKIYQGKPMTIIWIFNGGSP